MLNACQQVASWFVPQPTLLVLSTPTVQNPLCAGGSGSISVAATGGTTPYAYVWNTGATGAFLGPVGAGTYSVTVTDANNCTASQTNIAVVAPPPLVAAPPAVTNVSCYGGNNGAIFLSVSGGVGPYTYAWNTGATTSSITSLTAGFYSVTITDSNGCVLTLTNIQVTQPTDPIQVTVSTLAASCDGQANGAANLTVTGGTPGYTYLWSPTGSTSSSLVNVPAGTYLFTVTDAANCQYRSGAVISQNSNISYAVQVTNVACNGQPAGAAAVVNVTGGLPPYQYHWSTGSSQSSIGGLFAGTYGVTVSDASVNQCTASSAVTVTQPAPLAVSGVVTDVACALTASGSIALTVAGGTLPYTYAWSNGATTQNIANLVSGQYYVTVTDGHQCVALDTFTVASPPGLQVAVTLVQNVSCYGQATGAVHVLVQGGTPPYQFSWSNGATTQNLDGVVAGTYSLSVTDAQGCTGSIVQTVSQPSSPLLSSATTVAASCDGASNGAVFLSVGGGTPPYSYLWSNSATTQNLTNVPTGPYSVTITDAALCTRVQTAYVGLNSAISVVGTVQPVSCFGGSNGAISIAVTGGNPPYSYVWSPGEEGVGGGWWCVAGFDVLVRRRHHAEHQRPDVGHLHRDGARQRAQRLPTSRQLVRAAADAPRAAAQHHTRALLWRLHWLGEHAGQRRHSRVFVRVEHGRHHAQPGGRAQRPVQRDRERQPWMLRELCHAVGDAAVSAALCDAVQHALARQRRHRHGRGTGRHAALPVPVEHRRHCVQHRRAAARQLLGHRHGPQRMPSRGHDRGGARAGAHHPVPAAVSAAVPRRLQPRRDGLPRGEPVPRLHPHVHGPDHARLRQHRDRAAHVERGLRPGVHAGPARD